MFNQEKEPITEFNKELPEDIQEAIEDFLSLADEKKQKPLEQISSFLSQAHSKKEWHERLSTVENYIWNKFRDPEPGFQKSEADQEIHDLLIRLLENKYPSQERR